MSIREVATLQEEVLDLSDQSEVKKIVSPHNEVTAQDLLDQSERSAFDSVQLEYGVVHYEKRKNVAKGKGEKYEFKLVALLFLRLYNCKQISEYQLASNASHAGAFDDIVVRYKLAIDLPDWFTWYMQLKHKEKATLSVASFVKSNDFLLEKYLKSFIEIKKMLSKDGKQVPVLFNCSIDKCLFVLYTNACTNKQLSERWSDCVSSDSQILKSGLANELVVEFSEANDGDIVGPLLEEENTRSDAKEFIRRLRLFSGQPSESQLDDFTKKQISVACMMNDADIVRVHRVYLEKIGRWWSDSDVILDQRSSLLAEAVDECITLPLSTKQEQDYTLDIKFKQTSYATDFMPAGASVLHIIPLVQSTKLCCSKVVQTLMGMDDAYIFLSLECLLSNTGAVMLTWASRMKRTLVIVSESKSEHADLCTTLCGVMQQTPQKKLVVISSEQDSFALYLRGHVTFVAYEVIRDDFSLVQLEDKSRRDLLNRTVDFQGFSLTLGEFLDDNVQQKPAVFNDDFIQGILNNPGVFRIGPELAANVTYYIPRTLQRNDIVNKDIFKATNTTDIFVVSDVTKMELQKLVPDGERVGVLGEPDCCDCRFLEATHRSCEDIAAVWDKTRNVHELTMAKDRLLRWTGTRGEIENVQRFVEYHQSNKYDYDTAASVNDRVVLLVDNPGMGKTVFMNHLATETKKANPSLWVVRVNLIEHMALMGSKSCEDGVDFFASALCIDKMSQTEHVLFRHSFEHQGNVVILLDGVDEIAPQYMDKCCVLLTSLLKTKACKIWVTSRRSMKNKLERVLSTLALSLEKFSESNQRSFLNAFWCGNIQPFPQSNELDQFISKLLQLISRSFNDKDKQFLGIPLQTLMLAEIFEDHVRKSTSTLPETLDVLTLFDMLIEKKFEIFVQKKLPSHCTNIDDVKHALRKVFDKNHMYAAVVLLLGEEELSCLGQDRKNKILKKYKEFHENFSMGGDKTGIVNDIVRGTPIFSHRTYAEYYVAMWFCKHYSSSRDFLRRMIFTDEYTVVRKMFDLTLTRGLKLLTSVVLNDLPRVIECLSEGEDAKCLDEGGRTAIHLAATLGFQYSVYYESVNTHDKAQHMVSFLLGQGSVWNTVDDVLDWTPLEYAMSSKSWDAVEMLLDETMEEGNLVLYEKHVKKVQHISLHHTAANGFTKLVKLQVLTGEDVWALDEQCRTPLHATCASTKGNFLIAKALVERVGDANKKVRNFINAQDKTGNSALHYVCKTMDCDSRIVKLLISNGADVLCRNKLGEIPLHVYFSKSGLSVVRAFIESMEERNVCVKEYINTRDSQGMSVLHWAVTSQYDSIVQYLISKGGDIWLADNDGRTPLHYACKMSFLDGIITLIECAGAGGGYVKDYINECDVEGLSSLHTICVSNASGTHYALKFLLLQGGCVWSVNKDGETPLISACKLGNLTTVKLLVGQFVNNANCLYTYINATDSGGLSAISWAGRKGHYDILKLLTCSGGEASWINNDTNPQRDDDLNITSEGDALFLSFLERYLDGLDRLSDRGIVPKYWDDDWKCLRQTVFFSPEVCTTEMITRLTSKGASIWDKNEYGQTPLIVASYKGHMDAVQSLINSIGENERIVTEYINQKGFDGRSAIHYACLNGHYNVINFLISKGADINTVNKHGVNLLHSACYNGKICSVQALIEHFGEDEIARKEYLNVRSTHNWSALHISSQVGDSKMVKYLLSLGADIWAAEEEHYTALHVACMNGKIDIVRVLIEHFGENELDCKKYVNLRSVKGVCALHFAAGHDCPSIIKLLVSKGADKWVTNVNGWNALHAACNCGFLECVKALLDSFEGNRAELSDYVNTYSVDGRLPVHYALMNRHSEILRLLFDIGTSWIVLQQ